MIANRFPLEGEKKKRPIVSYFVLILKSKYLFQLLKNTVGKYNIFLKVSIPYLNPQFVQLSCFRKFLEKGMALTHPSVCNCVRSESCSGEDSLPQTEALREGPWTSKQQ